MITIPLIGGAVNAHQLFTMTLGGRSLDFRLTYGTESSVPTWSMDISETAAAPGVNIVSGAMLEPRGDIIKLYNAGIGKFYFIGAEVTLDNLGSDNELIWFAE